MRFQRCRWLLRIWTLFRFSKSEKKTNLMNLKLNANIISSIPAAELMGLTSLEVLDLSYNLLSSLPPTIASLSALRSLSLTGNQLQDLPPELSRLSRSLAILDVRLNHLTAVPVCVFALSALSTLNFRRNRIGTFSLPSPVPFSNLQTLVMSHNNLATLSGNFSELRSLTLIDFSHNKLTEMPDLTGLNSLKTINFSHNLLTGPISEKIASLPSLMHLHLNDNQISAFLPDEIPGPVFPSLQELQIDSNSIASLSPALFKQGACPKLITLNATRNRIVAFPIPDSDNIPVAKYPYLATVKTILLGSNKISTLSPAINLFTALEELNVFANKLSSLPPLGGLTNLQQLFVSFNNLSTLPPLPTSLEELYANNNRITELPPLSPFTNLIVINCSFNSIKNSPVGLEDLRWGGSIQRVDFTGNPCFPSMLQGTYTEWIAFFETVTEHDHLVIRSFALDHEKDPNIFSPSGRFSVGIADTIGRRPTMEDAICVTASPLDFSVSVDFFGVYDGHGGSAASKFVCSQFHNTLWKKLSQKTSASSALQESVSEVEEMLRTNLRSAPTEERHCGTTLVCAIVFQEEFYVVNVGDSRALLVPKGGKAVRVSQDHNPLSAMEQRRIRRAGGYVNEESGRVNGNVAVSRSLGDFYMQPFLTAVPSVSDPITYLTGDYLVLACDGVFEALSDEQVADIVVGCEDLSAAAAAIRDSAYLLGSTDNITALVVQL
eukprot:TRINITY_DN4099_c0_g1_i4.p1 TRINITY_DN4099_c0_g1~~TRINITY_DN4099_c0_g1_i4.p1  ORF type:complete len:720 (+),score=202.58 TRINITY_DN4099_c0_g1_i4:1522-3681(+)